ncbi:unnamed protein product [Gulo gulo]|uniref:Uncharacterized protein n=1 Tax=Gulo gulo TaxID=48420 RepID=A0A9X9M0Z6_GULGU|nr:unnamed protein product [Gulo gulo]
MVPSDDIQGSLLISLTIHSLTHSLIHMCSISGARALLPGTGGVPITLWPIFWFCRTRS